MADAPGRAAIAIRRRATRDRGVAGRRARGRQRAIVSGRTGGASLYRRTSVNGGGRASLADPSDGRAIGVSGRRVLQAGRGRRAVRDANRRGVAADRRVAGNGQREHVRDRHGAVRERRVPPARAGGTGRGPRAGRLFRVDE